MDQPTSADDIIQEMENALSLLTKTKIKSFTLSSTFTFIFMQYFWNKLPVYSETVLNQSNWTYHTAFSIKRAAELLNLDCVFETMGRLDAIIQIPDDPPETILFAEWEAKYEDVFGTGKELEKLWKGTTSNQGTNALLVTYCPLENYGGFLREVTKYWQNEDKRRKKRPVLFLVTILYQVTKNLHVFHTISGTEIHKEGVKIWGPFDNNQVTY